jgi:two-component system, sporulation sensor kinase D
MNAYELKRLIRVILMLLALLISIATLLVSQKLAHQIEEEETARMELWAEAERLLNDPYNEGDLGFYLDVIKSNTTIPAILVDDQLNIIQSVNVNAKTPKALQESLQRFRVEHPPILVPIDRDLTYRVYYGDSTITKQLRYYPYGVLGIVAVFILLAYLAFSYSTRSEQNQVWVGLAKETAHQLGTPISSLLGWIDCLEADVFPAEAPDEMRKDIERLQVITERFSKIGSEPTLEPVILSEVLSQSVDYMKSRSGKNVQLYYQAPTKPIRAEININLFNWVIENIIKNAVDAMEGEGTIFCTLAFRNGLAYIDISDSGKGIPKNQMKDIFQPGFTTKKRGWGLGLSLAKRIVRDYHKGDIFVKESVPFKRTTLRITLKATQ